MMPRRSIRSDGHAIVTLPLGVQMTTMHLKTLLLLMALLMLTALLSVWTGSTQASVDDWLRLLQSCSLPNDALHYAVVSVRLPRVLLACLAGWCVAVSGAMLQSIARNPLADPGLLGLSQGAVTAVMALRVLLPTAPAWLTSLGGVLGGVGVALLLVVLVGRTRTNGLAILLMGIAMESVLSSVAAVLLLYLPGDASVAMAEWMAGSLFQANWASLSILLVLVALSLPALLLAGPSLAVQALGTDMAMALGLEAARIRPALLLLAVLMNTLAVAVVGPLTLLGVIAPQLADFACRSSGSMRLILSGLMGSLLVLMADTVSRGLLADTALPVGLALTLVGVPLFVAAMRLQAWRKGRVS